MSNSTYPLAYGSTESVAVDYLTGGLLGILAGSATISQGITYLLRHRDGRDFRSLVCFVLVLGLGHLVLTMSDLITTCAARRETSASTRIHSPMYSAMLVLDGLITGIVQAFYGWRCWALFGRNVLVAISVALSLAFTISTWIYFAIVTQVSNDGNAWPRLATTLCFLSPMVMDLLVMTLMLYQLHSWRQLRDECGSTLRVVGSVSIFRRIFFLTVSTNGLTLIFCTIQLGATLKQWTSGGLWNASDVLLPMQPFVYILTLLVWLMNRNSPTDISSYQTSVRFKQGSPISPSYFPTSHKVSLSLSTSTGSEHSRMGSSSTSSYHSVPPSSPMMPHTPTFPSPVLQSPVHGGMSEHRFNPFVGNGITEV